MKQAHVFISGIVQGVGYRFFVKATVHDLGLTGWVRNTEAGGVEAVLQGEEEAIHKLIDLCKKGPFLSKVKQVWFEWEDIGESFSEFGIRN